MRLFVLWLAWGIWRKEVRERREARLERYFEKLSQRHDIVDLFILFWLWKYEVISDDKFYQVLHGQGYTW